MADIRENVIEWIMGQDTATATFYQGRYISRIKKLAADRPDEVTLIAENKDGSILVQFPLSWLKINPTRILTDEQREEYRERMKIYHAHKEHD